MTRQDAVILYCTRADCQIGIAVINAEIPPLCPGCERPTKWSTTPPHGDRPRIPYTLTANDEAFLKRRGIDSERPNTEPDRSD